MSRQFAIIAGSGFDAFGGDGETQDVVTRFGVPSSAVRRLSYEATTVFALARHGDSISIPPHRINYRANLTALQQLGVGAVIALNTVGVIPPRPYPGQLAVPDQLIDYTSGREHTIYDGADGQLDHIEFTEPLTASLRVALLDAGEAAGLSCYAGGAYGVTQGPRLETAAEVDRFERDGVMYLGMTALPEAAIARELGMDYACLSLIVNRAAGRGEGEIHADIENHMMTAKLQAIRLLKQFFARET